MSAHAYTPAELEGIARRLGEAGRSGGGWSCRCPVHDDRTASLSLSLGEGGRLLWHCHAGCDQAAVLDGLRVAGVLLNGDARPAEPRPKARGRGRIVAAYPYVDEAGTLLFEVVRHEPKGFRQRRPDGEGGWAWKLGDARRVLFRLPEVVAAEEVVVVEGEKDALALAAAGLCATTSPQGAKFWRDELAAPLAGKRVAVLPDNDEAGREHAHRVAHAARRHGAASVKLVELEGLPPKGDVSDWLAAGHTADELRALIAETPEWEPAQREEPEDQAEEDEDRRPLIRVYGGGLHRNAADAAKALGAATHADPFQGVYRRGSLLARPGRIHNGTELERAGVRRSPGALVILAAEVDYLAYALTKHARWERFDKRSEEWVPTNAASDVTKALAAAADQIGHIPPLAGIVEAPTVRPDGTLLDRPGYDPATRLLFDPGGVEFPPIPADPTRAQAEAALATLREPLAEFPFADEASEAVILSEILAALTRKAMRAAPLHVVTAPKMASGKTLLATIGGYVATGRAPAMMSQAEDPESERKRLLAVLLEGAPLVVIDNVERPLKSDALCSVLTEPLFTDRLLGFSRTATAPTNALFVATGNNIVVAGDLTARAVVCTLDPMCERPEERRFRVDLHDWVPRNRGRLVAAALTVVRAYLAAGEPMRGELPNFARFEDWSRLVREPLVWLGMADPCLTRRTIEERDPVRERLTGLLRAWREAFGETPATVAQAVQAAAETAASAEPMQSEPRHPVLAEVVAAVADERGRVNPRRLGNFISAHAGRIEAGMRFERAGDRKSVALWAVSLVGSAGFAGRSNPYARNCHEECATDTYVKLGGTDPRNPPNQPATSDEPDDEVEL